MAITVDTIQLKFNVKPSYEQQEIQRMNADLKQAEANYESIVKVVKDNAKEHSRLYGELSKVTSKRDELASKKSLTEDEQQKLAEYNQKIEDLNDKLEENKNEQAQLIKASEEARKEMVEYQGRMNGVTQSTLKYNMSIKQLSDRERELKALLNNIDPSTEEWEQYNKELSETRKRIADLRRQAPDFHNELKLEDMTIKQLKERINALQSALESCKPNTDEFREYSQALQETENQLNNVTSSVKESLGKFGGGGFLSKVIGAETDFKGIKTFLSGNLLVKGATMVFGTVAEYAGRAVDRVREFVSESVQAARAAEGIQHAFERIDQPGMLDNLRKATHGTVSDIELMKAAVQASDFRLPLDQLGKYLEFAQLKAQQTGQSVDYMTNSIVTGLGRKSVMILDNLGISASEIKEEMAKTGDMATAVGNIIDKQLAQTGEHFETAAEREQQATTNVTNAQLQLGQQMKATFGIGSTSFSEMQAKAEVFILKGLTKLIIWCQDLYNRLGSVRLVVETVKVAFDTVFKICEIGFRWLADTVKHVARGVRDLAGMVEGVFTFDWDKVRQSGANLIKDVSKSIREFVSDGKDVGTRWGKNVIDSAKAVMGKTKVKGPDIEMPRPKMPAPESSTPDNPTLAKSPAAASSTPADDNFQRDLATREQAYREYVNQLKQMYLGQLLSEKEYQAESLQAESKFLADKIALQELYGKDSTQTQGQYLDLLIRESNDKYKQSQQQLKDSLAQADADHATQSRQLLEQRLNGELDTEERYNELKLQADIDYQRRRLEILRAAGADTAQAEQQLLQLLLQQRQSKEQQETQVLNEETEKRKQIQQAAQQAVGDLMQSASQLFSAMQQRETAQVDAKYKKLIASAKKQGKDTTKLEEQMQAEKDAIAKKYAEKQFAMQVLQIIASTATGIAKTIAELGMPWAIPFVAMTAAAGAMQLASAKAAADQAAGLYEGGYNDEYQEGYTRKGDPKKQAGVIPVHQSEFVANHKAVANPEVRPVLDVIDRHQKAGDIQMLNATRMLEEAYGRGRYRGGYTNGASGGSPESEDGGLQELESISQIVDLLYRIADNTADSLTVREVRDKIRQIEQLERNARR